jgi:hypothetical protein
MKRNLYTRPFAIAATFVCMLATGCKEDFLIEKPVSTLTTDVYYVTEAGYEDLVKSCYSLLRNIHQNRNLVLNGTDVFSSANGWSSPLKIDGSPLDLYDTRFNASNITELQSYWQLLYTQIGRTNTAIDRSAALTSMAPALRETRMAEAKFLRALCYFYLVQQWGDVPMPLTEAKTGSKETTKASSADIYKQIINDLLECEAKLPVTASNYGRATKGAAQFLLSRVYLTRGWNYKNSLGGSSTDFDMALQYADKVIDAYPLAASYNQLFPIKNKNPLKQYTSAQNDKNPEIIFSVQYNTDVLTNKTDPAFAVDAAGGNNLHSRFGGNGESYPGSKGRTTDYNRNEPYHITTPAMYRLFDTQLDSRYDHNFVEVGYALTNVNDFRPISLNQNLKINIKAGDTVVYFRPWNQPALTIEERGLDMGGTKNYAVMNVSDYGGAYPLTSGYNAGQHPMMWKFWQPGLPYGDAFGTFNESIFRVAEAYLIAAEAIVKGAKGGKLGTADVYYNKVLDRALGTHSGANPQCAAEPGDVNSLAAISYRATPSNITIDLILDERARELMGEYCRWYDLKRTNKLVERVKKYNPWTTKGMAISEKHYLRPIPQSEIDLSYPPLKQNDGY